MADLKEIFAETLRQTRETHGWSQEKLALECGLSAQFIALMEQAKRQPSLTTLFKLARNLDTTPGALIGPSWEEYLNQPHEEPWRV